MAAWAPRSRCGQPIARRYARAEEVGLRRCTACGLDLARRSGRAGRKLARTLRRARGPGEEAQERGEGDGGAEAAEGEVEAVGRPGQLEVGDGSAGLLERGGERAALRDRHHLIVCA